MIQSMGAILLVVATAAQMGMGSLQGTVTDEQGNPIEDAVVTLENLSRGGEVEAETNDKGNFYRGNLLSSDYVITIEKEGFQTFQAQLRVGAGQELRQNFQLVSAITPVEAAFQRGVQAFQEGNPENAVAAFEEVVKLAPNASEGHINLGLAYLQLNRIDDAIRALEQASQLAADNFSVWMQLGSAYAQAQELEKAIEAFETGLTKEHEPGDPMAVEANLGLGLLYFATGQGPKAIEKYEAALALDPSSPAALLGIGKAHYSAGDPEQAAKYFERLVQEAPDSPQAEEGGRLLQEIQRN